MINKLKPKSEFAKNVLTLMTGTTIAQAIPIAISPILTRLYTPEDFGIFALFVSITSILGSIASGSYEYAIMLPKKDEDAINIVALGIIITTIFSFIIFLVVLFFNNKIVKLLNNKEISLWLYFIPLAVLLTGFYNVLNYWNNRKKYYKDLAKATVIKSIANTITQLSLGFIKVGASGLISGQVISQMFANGKLFKNLIKEKTILKKINKNSILFLFKRYIKFPKYSLPNVLIDSFREQGFNILISSVYNITTLGQYYLAQRMLKLPMSIIGSSISQVFLQKMSVVDKRELFNLSWNFVKKALIISLPIFTVVYFFAGDLFIIIFGEKWKTAGDIASILSFWICLTFVSSPLSNIFIILEKQHIVLIYAIIYAIVPIVLIFLMQDFIQMLKLLSFSMIVILVVFIGHIFYILQRERL
ncbi:lipopolysaccharide biosynthesis protein [Hippea jasoniae]|uniref:lipopolysaccharide biosynthesis protein n=1 Tax=Hippea jasoniae TaxID=944479 RepID=UPI000691454E|nr:oligosaccharide flippase family protein [Hippea jasoniae]